MRLLSTIVLISLLLGTYADVYMHMPKGSNNRLNEQSAERNNGNRLFDSQNNNRGGYNVGDKSNNAFSPNNPTRTPTETYDFTKPADTGYTAMQYQMLHFEKSTLTFEWTNQHGCGGNEGTDTHKLNCQIIIQYMCNVDYTSKAAPTEDLVVDLKDGGNTNTPDEPNSYDTINTTRDSNNNNQRGRHESEAFYYMCKRKQRNYGLFHADQNINGQSSQYTRQNNNGNRRGLECPEERDYYPWWNPSPWIDIAYLTDHVEHCDQYIATGSQNNNNVWFCAGLLHNATSSNLIPLTQTDCVKKGGTWRSYNKGLPAPYCGQVGWSRVNHLGNGRDGQPLTFNWTLPAYQDLVNYGAKVESGYIKCVARLRYNMSTDDYDAYNINSTRDDDERNGILSPIRQNPTVDIGTRDLVGLRLAINTNQFGRTFQDRSHVFHITARPSNNIIPANAEVWNLNVRGKRGNIVQTFPSVEYDFVPNRLHIGTSSFIHVQWTGSNTHNNGNPAGDGQAGDAGEGTTGTDRHNFVQLRAPNENYPLPLDKFQNQPGFFWKDFKCFDKNGAAISWQDCAMIMATSGQYRTIADATTTTKQFNSLLNDAPASLVGGIILQPTTAGTYFYTCTRNNNFSNRSQKGTIIVN